RAMGDGSQSGSGLRAAPEERPPAPDRRAFLRRAAQFGGAAIALSAASAARAEDSARNLPPNVPEWGQRLGAPILAHPYGSPSSYEAKIQRRESPGLTRTPHSSVSFTPLQNLFGIITPSGLHFERHHAGVPEIDPHQHRLLVHGLVSNPRIYDMD